MAEHNAPFRVALRDRGAMIKMYVAPPNSMEGAITVMTMKKSVAQLHPEVHEAILKLAEVIGKHLLISHGVKAEDIVRYDRIYKDGTQPK